MAGEGAGPDETTYNPRVPNPQPGDDPYGGIPKSLMDALARFSANSFIPKPGVPSSNSFGMFGNALTPYGNLGDQIHDAMIQSRVVGDPGKNPFANNSAMRYNFSNFPASLGGGNTGKSAYAPGIFNPYGASPGGGAPGGGAPGGGAGTLPPPPPPGGGVGTLPPPGYGPRAPDPTRTGPPPPGGGGGRVGDGTTPQPIGGGSRVPTVTPPPPQIPGNPMQSGTSGSFTGPLAAWQDAQKALEAMGPAGADELARLRQTTNAQGLNTGGPGETSLEAMMAHFNSLGSDTERFNYVNAIDQYQLGKGGVNNLGASFQAGLRNQLGKTNFDRWYGQMSDTNKGVHMEGVPAWLQAALK